jgi:hypothetical protein
MQKELFYILLFLFFSCKQDNRKEELYLEKTNQLEKDLEVLKNITFISYLGELESLSYVKQGINIKDSCFKSIEIKDVSMHQYVNTTDLRLEYVFDDINRKKLIKKWVFKKFDLVPLESGTTKPHSFNFYKSLEFYKSEDLAKYLDSVRKVELKKLEL